MSTVKVTVSGDGPFTRIVSLLEHACQSSQTAKMRESLHITDIEIASDKVLRTGRGWQMVLLVTEDDEQVSPPKHCDTCDDTGVIEVPEQDGESTYTTACTACDRQMPLEPSSGPAPF